MDRYVRDRLVLGRIRSTPVLVIDGREHFLRGDQSNPHVVFGFYEAGGFYFVASGPGPGIIRMGQPRPVSVFDSEGRFRGRG